MKTIKYPPEASWPSLCKRPSIGRADLDRSVSEILSAVREKGDEAISYYSEKYDGLKLSDFRVPAEKISGSAGLIDGRLRKAILTASSNIEKFHRNQLADEKVIETFPGVKCWRKPVPVEKAGLYIPGGTAPLFSTVLMLAIPAKLAGCRRIILCTPPAADGSINPLILYASFITGVTDLFAIGGAQAIAAMAYGTATVPKADKIFGPGNQYVTRAKEMIQLDGIPIDMPAGPSEVLVIADGSADPAFIASDLLSQAEHGADSQVILVTDTPELLMRVEDKISLLIGLLPRKEIAEKALENSLMILLGSMEECIGFSNQYAPEHLILNTVNPSQLAGNVRNAGSVFLGKYSCESAGDYATGTNHTLPTGGYARNYSGVSVESFMKKISFQEVSREGLLSLGPEIELMAEAESLHGHKNAVTLRLKSLENV